MSLSVEEISKLEEIAIRVRSLSLWMIYKTGTGYPGGCLSAADLLTYLYLYELRLKKDRPGWPARDRFILSKGSPCPALYATAAEMGFIKPDELGELCEPGTDLQGHRDHLNNKPWVETATGSLGQGVSAGLGMAMGLRYQHNPARIYVMVSNSEMHEGEIWEAAMCARHYRLDNLCGILDYNQTQDDDLNENIMKIDPLRAKWEASDWEVMEIDGHNFIEMEQSFTEAKRVKNKPSLIIAHTIKGKGVSFMENSPLWYDRVKLGDEDLYLALRDLNTTAEEMARCVNL